MDYDKKTDVDSKIKNGVNYEIKHKRYIRDHSKFYK